MRRGYRGDQPLEPRVPLPIRGCEDREKLRRNIRRLGIGGGCESNGRGAGRERFSDRNGREGGGITGTENGRRHSRGRASGGGGGGGGGDDPAH